MIAAMVRSEFEGVIAEGDFSPEDLQKLRIAVVMTGGVSLAVWMGGVAHELNRLIRGEDRTYLKLLQMTRVLPRVDVIAGTSAGGMNGALLAYAAVQEAPLTGLRDLWLELGALEELLRSPTAADPPSLLKGDDYLLAKMRDALARLTNRTTDPREVPIDLTITTTLLKPWPQGVADSFGTIVQSADHRGEFTFRRRDDALATTDDFAATDICDRLALAARCTSSFPFAFEALDVPVGASDGDRPDMAGQASFSASRWVIDGGSDQPAVASGAARDLPAARGQAGAAGARLRRPRPGGSDAARGRSARRSANARRRRRREHAPASTQPIGRGRPRRAHDA